MDYASLIDKLQSLPEDKQTTVFDFVEFMANRNRVEPDQQKTLAESSLAVLMKNPLVMTDFITLNHGHYK